MALDSFEAEKKIVKSGFRAGGLMPFNPEAVEFNVLKKKKKTKTDHQENQHFQSLKFVTNHKIEDKERHLKTFEEKVAARLLEDFKKAE